MQGQIFTVNPHDNLAAQTVAYILKQIDNQNPLSLTDVTLWVPSPRAALALKNAFMEKAGAGLLPHIRMMSFHEEDMDTFRFENENLEEQEAVTGLSRLMVLTQLVLMKDKTLTFSMALERATALAQVFHRLKNYQISLDEISALVPPELAHHWEENLQFFRIAFDFYPTWLAAHEKVDSADIALKTVQAFCDNYKNKGIQHPTFAVGFSDTTPLGKKLIAEIIQHEKGGLVLPAFDLEMKEDAYQSLKPTHPCYSMKRLLDFLKISRSDVKILGDKTDARTKVWRYALAPSDEMGQVLTDLALKGMTGLNLVETKSNSEEAETIALLMRETLEHKGKTCALISPDRSLALRVEASLKRWGINVDDSAGVPLATTALGHLFKLVADVVQERFRPLLLAELLYHPLVRLPECENFDEKRHVLDLLVLRGPKPAMGFAGLKKALQRNQQNPYKDTSKADQALALIELLEDVFEPLQTKNTQREVVLWVARHMQVLRRLTGQNNDEQHFDDEAGQTLIALLNQWQSASADVGALPFSTYTETLHNVMSNCAVRKRHSTHPRLFIWGPMESRMQHADRIIIGAVNEGAWPRSATVDPWLNKSIAQKLGLPTSDHHVGLSAHDFLSLACKKEVFLTRCLKDEGGETIPSRFLSRLQAVLPEEVYGELQQKGQLWLERARLLRCQGQVHKPKAPYMPVNIARRPKVWSASTVRDMMACPYKVYIHKILNLQALELHESAPTAADRGQIFHKILESFFATVEKMPPPYKGDYTNQQAVYEHLMRAAEQAFLDIDQKGVKAVWVRKFSEVAKDFAKQLVLDSQQGRHVLSVEQEAKRIPLTPYVALKARADRIDKDAEGNAIIVDYKTGTPPAPKQVLNGEEPQMATEAFIAMHGGYGKDLTVGGLEYWHISGKKNKPIDRKNAIKGKKGDEIDMETFIDIASNGLTRLAKTYGEGEKAYEAFPGGATAEEKEGACKYCDYSGLCRYKDWIGDIK